ncbi:MAG: prolipoprotein diacylglyceryl transferase family protein [Patescibacteria group bacterium]|nr:prolipoprotein diacylglyceryl transferase family protein [Patescibacteria group bacterium]
MCPSIDLLGLTVPTYGIMVACGLIASGVVAWRLPVRKPEQLQLSSGVGDSLLIPGVLGLVIGAKLPLLLSHGLHAELLGAGKSVLGALLGAYAAVRVAKWLRGLRFTGGGDAFVLPITAGMVFGRVGCLLNGCCWGRHGFPAPLVEIAFHAGAFGLFVVLRRRNAMRGCWLQAYLLAYCILRFGLEFVRTEPRVLAGLTVYHWLCLVGMAAFTWELWRRTSAGAAVPAGASEEGCP